MTRRIKVSVVLIVLLVSILWAVQPALAQADPSLKRVLGMGLLWPTLGMRYFVPTILSIRVWPGDVLGLEGLLTMFSFSTEYISVSVLAGGGGILWKMINTTLLDLYAAARVMVIRPQIPLNISIPSITAMFGAMGLEISLMRFIALSLEVTFLTGMTIPGLGAFGLGGFVFTLGGAIHMYF